MFQFLLVSKVADKILDIKVNIILELFRIFLCILDLTKCM